MRVKLVHPLVMFSFNLTNLKGISTTSFDFNCNPGYIFMYSLDDIINAAETNTIEQKIHIHTNWVKKFKNMYLNFPFFLNWNKIWVFLLFRKVFRGYDCRTVSSRGFFWKSGWFSLLIRESYPLVKSPNRFHIGVNSCGYLVSKCLGM